MVQVAVKLAFSSDTGHWSSWSQPVRASVPQSAGTNKLRKGLHVKRATDKELIPINEAKTLFMLFLFQKKYHFVAPLTCKMLPVAGMELYTEQKTMTNFSTR